MNHKDAENTQGSCTVTVVSGHSLQCIILIIQKMLDDSEKRCKIVEGK